MPIDGSQVLDKNARRFSLPADSCVGDGVGDPFAGGKSAGKAAAQSAGPSLTFSGGPTPDAKNWGSK